MLRDHDRCASAEVDDLMAAARAAVPVLAANAGRADRDLRLPAESIAVLRDAGAFALSTPARFRGLEADLPTTVRMISELGRGCPSSAWPYAFVAADALGARGP